MEVTSAILLGLLNRITEAFKAALTASPFDQTLSQDEHNLIVILFAAVVGIALAVGGQYDPLSAVPTLAGFTPFEREAAAGVALSLGSGGIQWVLDLVKAWTSVGQAKAESAKVQTAVAREQLAKPVAFK